MVKIHHLKFAALIFILGFFGVISLLLMPLPQLSHNIPGYLAPLLLLINATILLLIASFLGVYLAPQINLHAPVLEALLLKKNISSLFMQQLRVGSIYGVSAGLSLKFLYLFATPYLPEAYIALTKSLYLSPVTKLLYGGITEEILLRWGFMTVIAWMLWKSVKQQKDYIYILAILLSAGVFALGHLPAAYSLVPEITPQLLIYLILGNTLFGLIAGYLFWIYGLEAAICAHMVCHLVLICC